MITQSHVRDSRWPAFARRALVLSVCATLSLPVAVPAQSSWQQADVRGMGFVTGITIHPVNGEVYIRTDVGGAYKWDAAASVWRPLLDNKSSPDDAAYYDVESLTLDPASTTRLFAAVGTGTASNTYLIRSNDGGSTWERLAKPTDLVIRANDYWRWSGERFQVDPRNSAVLYYASRTTGLWRSTNGSAAASSVSWSNIGTVPVGDHGGAFADQQKTKPVAGGVTFVAIDPRSTQVVNSGTSNERAKNVFVGVMGEGIYRSTNGGNTFTKISTADQDLPDANGRPQLHPIQGRFSSDGTLYVTFTRGRDLSDPVRRGSIWRFDTSGTWTRLDTNVTDWTGGNAPWTGIGVSGNRVLAIADGRVPETYIYSSDRGVTWTSVSIESGYHRRMDHARPAWWHDIRYSPAGGVAFDAGPNAGSGAWFTTGWGVHRIPDVLPSDGSRVQLDSDGAMKGVEELIYTQVFAMPAANTARRLITLNNDIPFLVFNDVTQTPSLLVTDSNNDNGTGLAYSYKHPNTIAMVGSNYTWLGTPRNFRSTDGGVTWSTLNPPLTGTRGGNIAIASNNPSLMIWVPLNWGGSSGVFKPHFTRDGGATWTRLTGLPDVSAALSTAWREAQILVADTALDNTFYYVEEWYPAKVHKIVIEPGQSPTISTYSTTLAGGQQVRLEAAPGVAGELWCNVRNVTNEGLHFSVNGGQSFTRLTNITGVRAFTVGLPLAGMTTPTVYAAGTVSGVAGVFYSTDRGGTWTRVNLGGTALPFAKITALAADFRTVGRLYVGTSGRGVFSADVAGASVTVPAVSVDSAAARWRSASVAKVADPNGNNLYGEDGYIWFATSAPGATGGYQQWVNPFTSTHSKANTLRSLPSWLTVSSVIANPSTAGDYGYTTLDDPSASGASLEAGLGILRNTTASSAFQDYATFTVGSGVPAGGFRLGVVSGISANEPAQVEVSVMGGSSATQTLNTPWLLRAWFFDVRGAKQGDVVRVRVKPALNASNVPKSEVILNGFLIDRL